MKGRQENSLVGVSQRIAVHKREAMPRIKYQEFKFRPASRAAIEQANVIINEYAQQGYDLTLRQLYYQFVSRDLLANSQENYKRLGSIINDARLAGLIDWSHITDRTRNLASQPHWRNPEEIISICARQFAVDKWAIQSYRVEVWIEKEALAGVFERVCTEHDVPYFCCRGYTSQSEMWAAGQRLLGYRKQGQQTIILHFGDHDPSGIDMSRDIRDRLAMFMNGTAPEFRRLALNMPQIQQYQPPPNPAKATDARFADYQQQHGDESWELDALEPAVLAALVEEALDEIRDPAAWADALAEEEEARRLLGVVAEQWDDLTESL